MTYTTLTSLLQEFNSRYPSMKTLWHPFMFTVNHPVLIKVLNFIFHFLPTIALELFGQFGLTKVRMYKVYIALRKFFVLIRGLLNREWRFHRHNVNQLFDTLSAEDQKLFFFDMRVVNWHRYIEELVVGFRMFVLKDDLKTLTKARRRFNR